MTAPILNTANMHLIWKFDGSGSYSSVNIGAGTTGESFTTIANDRADRVRAANSILFTCTTAANGTGEYHRQQLGTPQDLSGYDHIAVVIEFDDGADDTPWLRTATYPANAAYDRGISFGIADTGGTYGAETSMLQFYGREPIFAVVLPIADLSAAPDLTDIDEVWVGLLQRESAGGPMRVIYHSAWAFNAADVFTPAKSGYSLHLDDQDIGQGPVSSGGYLYDELLSRDLLSCVTLCINPNSVGGAGKMSWDDIALYHANGACIINHGNTHIDADAETTADYLADVDAGYEALASRGLLGGNVCKAYAYPNGRTTKEIYEGLLERGYKIARTTARPIPGSPVGTSQYFNQALFPELGSGWNMYLRLLRLEATDTYHSTGALHNEALTKNRTKRQNHTVYGHDFVVSGAGARQFLRSEMEIHLDEVQTQIAAGTIFPQTLCRGSDSYAAMMGFSGAVDRINPPVTYDAAFGIIYDVTKLP